MATLGRVTLAISSFKNDEAVWGLLTTHRDVLSDFARVIVVDSFGTGELAGRLEDLGLGPKLEYHCYPENLGSAGNLARRLALSAEGRSDFVYALNHDGDLRPSAIAKLVALADRAPGRVGAVFPLRSMVQRGGRYDITGRLRFPFTAVRTARIPRDELTEVYWSSSNGALYALAPVREGLLPFSGLWMGYEDLGYGWLLASHGYKQFVARDVVVHDGYEYRSVGPVQVTNKPPWYAYYFARNLLLATKLTNQPLPIKALALSRVAIELGITLALRREKRARINATLEGIVDGLRARQGKWRLP